MRWNGVALLAALALVPGVASADVKPHALCGEGMVLQQRSNVKIWGSADPGEEVTVVFNIDEQTPQKERTKADDKGRWAVNLRTGAAGGPFAMSIAGKNTLNYKNVLVGEVWVCSGQSNMEWSINACDKNDKDHAFKAPHNQMLRCFQVAKTPMARPQTETKGTWVEADPKVIGNWTAVGYFFGRDINEHQKVPVGIIQSAWGGTRAEAWTSPAALEHDPAFKSEIDTFLSSTASPEAQAKPVANANAPSVLYNGMIAPLLNYPIKGAIWYQGESNAARGHAYRSLFPMMIQNWRADWKQPEFPFYFVQLAPFLAINKEPGESNWAELREAQSMTLKLPNTGQAVITDLGSEYDIHPTPKRPVGERLARIARARDYGEKIVYSGPVYKSVKIDANKAILSFDYVGGGLIAKELVPTLERKNPKTDQVAAAWRVKEGSEGAALVGFTVCGEDRKFHEAKAEIVGGTVVVTCETVSQLVAVRFGWADHPLCNLFNREGLPASPFRTDAFPVNSTPKQ